MYMPKYTRVWDSTEGLNENTTFHFLTNVFNQSCGDKRIFQRFVCNEYTYLDTQIQKRKPVYN